VKPLSRTSESEYERRLLLSARSESPDQDALDQLLTFLESEHARVPDAAGLEPPTSGVGRASRRGLLGRWLDWLTPSALPAPAWGLAGLLVGVIGGATLTALWLQPTPPAAVVLEAERSRSTAVPAGARSALPAASVGPAQPASAVQSGRPRSPSSAEARSSIPSAGIASEVELVESARKAVETGNSAEALRALDQHDRRFESGPLVSEARVLRIQALLKSGDYRAAEAAAHGFLAAHADSPYAGRVRALLHEAEQRRAAESSSPDAAR
jgi:hypothetical protein